jgi:dUTP pyrophosphatase
MEPLKVYFKNKKAQLTKGSPKSAGLDVVYCGEEDIKLNPTMRALLPTGIHMVIPDGYEMQVRPRSGLALKHGLTVLNSPGTIDSDFRKAVIIKPGRRKNSKKKKLKEEMGDSDQQENNAGNIYKLRW